MNRSSLDDRHDPRTSVAVVELIEPTLAVATDPIMREPQREYMPWQPSLPTPHPRSRETLDGNTTTAHPQPNATAPVPTSRARGFATASTSLFAAAIRVLDPAIRVTQPREWRRELHPSSEDRRHGAVTLDTVAFLDTPLPDMGAAGAEAWGIHNWWSQR